MDFVVVLKRVGRHSHRTVPLVPFRATTKKSNPRPGNLAKAKGILLHQDNAPPNKADVTIATIRDYGFEIVPHSSYCPDLAQSDNTCSRIKKKTNPPTSVKRNIALIMKP